MSVIGVISPLYVELFGTLLITGDFGPILNFEVPITEVQLLDLCPKNNLLHLAELMSPAKSLTFSELHFWIRKKPSNLKGLRV